MCGGNDGISRVGRWKLDEKRERRAGGGAVSWLEVKEGCVTRVGVRTVLDGRVCYECWCGNSLLTPVTDLPGEFYMQVSACGVWWCVRVCVCMCMWRWEGGGAVSWLEVKEGCVTSVGVRTVVEGRVCYECWCGNSGSREGVLRVLVWEQW